MYREVVFRTNLWARRVAFVTDCLYIVILYDTDDRSAKVWECGTTGPV